MLSAKNKTVDQSEIELQSKPESREEKPSSWLIDSEDGWIYKIPQIYIVQFSKNRSNHLRSAKPESRERKLLQSSDEIRVLKKVHTGRRG